jgi:hypothetical protein
MKKIDNSIQVGQLRMCKTNKVCYVITNIKYYEEYYDSISIKWLDNGELGDYDYQAIEFDDPL